MQETLTGHVFSFRLQVMHTEYISSRPSCRSIFSLSEFNMKDEFGLRMPKLWKFLEAVDLLTILEDQSISSFSHSNNQDTGSTVARKQSTPSTEYIHLHVHNISYLSCYKRK
jgi:hypothetical protein